MDLPIEFTNLQERLKKRDILMRKSTFQELLALRFSSPVKKNCSGFLINIIILLLFHCFISLDTFISISIASSKEF